MRRQLTVGPLDVSQDRPDVRMLHPAEGKTAGLEQLMPHGVQGSRAVIATPQQGVLVGVSRHARKDLADLDPWYVGLDRIVGPADLDGGLRLHVEGVELGGPAHQHQHDHIDVPGGVRDGPLGAHLEEFGHPEPQQAQGTHMKKVTTAGTVAELHGLVGV